MSSERDGLDYYTRREIADSVWRIFALMTDEVYLSYSQNGVTVQVTFKEELEMEGGGPVSGSIRGIHRYVEE